LLLWRVEVGAEQAAALGRRPFSDRRGPLPLYPSGKPLIARAPVRTSHADQPDDPDDPVRLLIRKAYARRLEGRNLTAIRPEDAPTARALLLGLIDRVTGRLNVLAAAHQEQAAKLSALITDALAFDASPEGERLRRHKNSCDRTLHRTIATFLKIRKEVEIPECDTTDPEDAGYQSDRRQWSVTGQTEADESSPIEPTAGNNGDRQNEPTADDVRDRQNEPTGDVDDDLQNEPTAGAHDPANDLDAAYREAVEAVLACIRDPGAGSQSINMAGLEKAIVANAREIHRQEELETARREFYDRDPKYRVDAYQPTAARPGGLGTGLPPGTGLLTPPPPRWARVSCPPPWFNVTGDQNSGPKRESRHGSNQGNTPGMVQMVATQGNTPDSERRDRRAPQPPNERRVTAELVSALTCEVLPWFEPGRRTARESRGKGLTYRASGSPEHRHL